MFTNKDFLNYFNEIEVLEKTMRDIYKQAIVKVEDPAMKKFFEKLYIEETDHQNTVEQIKQVVISKFFD